MCENVASPTETDSAFEIVPARILVIDDTPAIHADIRKVLAPEAIQDELDELTAQLFDDGDGPCPPSLNYQVDSAFQGATGLNMVAKAIEDGQPYSMAFVDVRMPPGWNGVETIERIREVDQDIQIVMCTAYSDFSWRDIQNRFGRNDWMLIIHKPFDVAEVQQLACALSEKWSLARLASVNKQRLEENVTRRTSELHSANERLQKANRRLLTVNERLETEITARRAADDKVLHMAHHDLLTGLPNRELLVTKLQKCLDRAERDDRYRFAVVFVDLDDFKLVNDSMGHAAGDQILKNVASELSAAVAMRKNDEPQLLDTVARIGGDEFVILLDDISDSSDLMEFAERALESLARPMHIDDAELLPKASIGITVHERLCSTPHDLLRDADIALYAAKEKGRGGIAVFDQTMLDELQERLVIEADLRRAIERNEFVMHYQPLVDMQSTSIVSLEALVRWQHPTRGLLYPDKFIGIAEQSGLIDGLGKAVIREVCRFVRELSQNGMIDDGMRFAINVSQRQFEEGELVPCIRAAIEEFEIDGSQLMLEITETAMMENVANVQSQCEALSDMGLQIVLDDFGTGYSSLSMLHKLPFAAVKLDRAFVAMIPDAPDEFIPTIQAMALLAECYGFSLVAEGIETKEQYELLRDVECSIGQGYYFARPIDGNTLVGLLSRKSLQPAGNGA